MKLTDLMGKPVRDSSGRLLGRVHEIHAVNGNVTELVYGLAGFFERLTGTFEPTTIGWSAVNRLDRTGITLREDA
jgi:sporulation protein YlmC with PRC-barrel domain